MSLSLRSAQEACRLWGDYRAIGRLSDPRPSAGAHGGSANQDDLGAVAAYVEATPAFELSLPVLRWVYVLGIPRLAAFTMQKAMPDRVVYLMTQDWEIGEDGKVKRRRIHSPASTEWRGFYRSSWAQYGGDTPAAARKILDQFEETLAFRLKDTPFFAPSTLDEICAADIGDSVNASLETALSSIGRRGFNSDWGRRGRGQRATKRGGR